MIASSYFSEFLQHLRNDITQIKANLDDLRTQINNTREAKRTLASHGVNQSFWVKIRPWLIGASIVLVALLLLNWIAESPTKSTDVGNSPQNKTKDILQILLLIIGFAFG